MPMLDVSFSLYELELFLLILMRISCFVYVAPFFGMSNTPGRVKIGLSLCLSVFMFSLLANGTYHVSYNSVVSYAVLVLKEAVTGLLIGFSANLCTSVLTLAGHIIDMETGLAMTSAFDPLTKEQASVSGFVYQYVIMLMLIVSGMHRYILQALLETFTLIPITGAILEGESLVNAFVGFLSDYLVIGFRICLPVLVVMVLLNAVLGILTKVAPQMNMFSVGMQLKVLVGIGILYLTVGMLPGAANFVFVEMKKMVVSVVEAMM